MQGAVALGVLWMSTAGERGMMETFTGQSRSLYLEQNGGEASSVDQETIDTKTSILIAARPDRMRDSLCLLLESRRGFRVVGHADDCGAALRMVAEQRPVLVLLDTNLPGERLAVLLEQIRINAPQSRCLVLADDVWQRREACAAGADGTLLKGFPAEELLQIIEQARAEREAGGDGCPAGGLPWPLKSTRRDQP